MRSRSFLVLTVLTLVVAAAGVLVLGAATYHDWLDGPLVPYVLGLTVAAGSALLAASAALAGVAPAWLCLSLALVLLLPSPVIHAARVAHRGMTVERELGRLVDYGSVLEPTIQGQASFAPVDGALALHVPAGSIGYLEVRRPDGDLSRWDVPRALYAPVSPHARESLAWTAEVVPTGHFFVLVDTGQLQAQVQVVGEQTLLRAAYAPPGADGPERTLTVPLPAARGERQWLLARGNGQIALRVDGQDLLAFPDGGPFRYLRLGETRTDPEHGGTLRLRALRYTRSLV